jgi:diguanylate cyclase (GGDEF)-like protein
MTLNTRGRIVLLVVIAALPALAFILYSTWDERVRAEAQAAQELRRLVRLAAHQQAEIIEGARQTLVAISLVPSVVLNDPPRCNDYLGKLLARSSGLYHSMGIYGADHVLICNGVPWRGKVVSPDRVYLQMARATGKFAIGEYQIGRVTRKEGINFGYPLKDAAGSVTGVAFVAVDLDNLNRMAAATPLPRQGILTVIDRDGLVLARKPTSEGRLGQKLRNPKVLQALHSAREGVFRAAGIDGAERLFAHDTVVENPAGPVPIRILISLPLTVVYGEANRAFVRNLAGIMIATVLLVVAGWYGAEIFVLRKIRVLLAAASRVRGGDLTARTGLRHDGEELSQVGEAFDEMTRALEQHDAELKRALQDLHEQAITDPLTGLVNRRYLREYLPRELTRAQRKEVPLAVVMVDIDYFKRVNDTFGHEAGDLVLRELGGLLRGQIRASDIACRFGGEEFALVLPEIPVGGAVQRAEAIRAAVKGLDLQYAGQPIGRLSASFGIAVFPDHAQDADSLLRLADEALYQAKGAGRDRVMVSGDAAKGAPPGVML